MKGENPAAAELGLSGGNKEFAKERLSYAFVFDAIRGRIRSLHHWHPDRSG